MYNDFSADEMVTGCLIFLDRRIQIKLKPDDAKAKTVTVIIRNIPTPKYEINPN